MNNHVKRIAAAGLALALSLALAACGGGESGGKVNEEKATSLVQGNLDEIYLGKFDPDYLELVSITENEAEETYLGGLEVEAETFMYYIDIEFTTDEVVCWPSDSALPCTCHPSTQATMPMTAAITGALIRPTMK